MPTDEEADNALHWLLDNVEASAQAAAELRYVTEYRKVLKAQIMKEHSNLSGVLQERQAYSDPQYVSLVKAIREAVLNDSRLTFKREAQKTLIDSWKTLSFANSRIKI